MSLTYAQYKAALETLAVEQASDTNWTTILPQVIEYAEARCYRDLDLIGLVRQNTSSGLTADDRDFSLPTPSGGTWDVVSEINVIISGSRTPLTKISLAAMNMLWPQESAPTTTSVPVYYAHVTDTTIVVGPPLGSAAGTATVEVVGTITPDALSASNTTTYLSTNYPDLILAASMIFISGYQRNFGAQADNPQQAQSWTAQYMTLLESAKRSETMKSGLPQTV
jgi:hypothetical protein